MSDCVLSEVGRNPDGPGFVYLVFVETEDGNTLEIGSGQCDTVKEANRVVSGLVERTLL